MHIAVLVKQIPAFEEMTLGDDGRLVRSSVALEMSAFCRRAVSEAVAIAKEHPGSVTTVFTLGPPSARDVLREAIAWGIDYGVHICDPQLAGSDTVATTKALAVAVAEHGPFDLLLVGRNSLDSETGHVGPGVAERLGWGFLPSVKRLSIEGTRADAVCEEDDGESDRSGDLPLVVATAERLIEPCKVDRTGWRNDDAADIATIGIESLGHGPWGAAASPTTVGEVRVHHQHRDRQILSGDLTDVADETVALLERRGALDSDGEDHHEVEEVGEFPPTSSRRIGVLVESGRNAVARELLGEANALGRKIGATVIAVTSGPFDEELLAAWGADGVEAVEGFNLGERDVALAVCSLVQEHVYWAILAPSTAWLGGLWPDSARIGAGLTGDALEFGVEEVSDSPLLVAWKSALGGQVLVAIRSSIQPQMATVRPGALNLRRPRPARPITVHTTHIDAIGGVDVRSIRRNDDVEELERATRIIGVGSGVDPAEYGAIESLAEVLGASIAATRRVTDNGWLPHARQIGITGRSLRPNLYVAIGVSGKFNHTVGVRAARTIVAVNSDPNAPIFGSCDVGIVGDWREVLPHLDFALRSRLKHLDV